MADVYTPQLVVVGWRQMSGNKSEEAEAALLEAWNHPKAGLKITQVTVDQNRLRVQIEIPQKAFSQDVDVKIDAKIDPHNLRVVAFLQDPESHVVFGATMRQLE